MSDNTINLRDFIQLLVAQVNCEESIAADFIREFSSAAGHGLAADGFVNVGGVGSFRVVNDVEGNPTVEFAPAPSLAASVNEPFAMFEPVELADSISDREIAEIKEEKTECNKDEERREYQNEAHEEISPEEVSAETQQPTVEVTPPPVPDRFKPKSTAPQPESKETPVAEMPLLPKAESEPHPEPPCIPTPLPVLLEPESHVTVKRVGHTTLTLLLAAVAALLLGGVIGLVIGYNFHRSLTTAHDAVETDSVKVETMSETVVSIPVVEPIDENLPDTEPAQSRPQEQEKPVVVTDTVAPGNYLSKMAKRHYGNSKFWVYIYLENKDKIRHPDNLEDGMVIVIPPAEKYSIDPQDKESLARAGREATRIANEEGM